MSLVNPLADRGDPGFFWTRGWSGSNDVSPFSVPYGYSGFSRPSVVTSKTDLAALRDLVVYSLGLRRHIRRLAIVSSVPEGPLATALTVL